MSLQTSWPELDQIPHPPGRSPETGDLESADFAKPMQQLHSRAKELGPIFETQMPGFAMVVVSGARIAADLFDDERFEKFTGFGMEAFRPITGDGLFTARNDEENWARARNILMPAFTRDALKRYHRTMARSATRLVRTWSTSDTPHQVDLADESIALALDIIGQAGFGYDFGSFERSTSGRRHPYVQSLVDALAFSMLPPPMQQERQAEFEEWIETINSTVDKVIEARQASPADDSDILGVMLAGIDPESGQRLSKENMRYQITTFMVAGYGTTASLIAFALYYLARHPHIRDQVRAEVDRVVGQDEITFENVARLRTLRRVIDETLRLWTPTPAFLRVAKTDTVIGDGIPVRKGGWAAVLTSGLHRDPGWGDDVETFDPDRFRSEQVRRRDANLYKPFGTGPRNCIGRQFALHAAAVALAEVTRSVQVSVPDDYELSVAEGGFFMPEGLTATISAR